MDKKRLSAASVAVGASVGFLLGLSHQQPGVPPRPAIHRASLPHVSTHEQTYMRFPRRPCHSAVVAASDSLDVRLNTQTCRLALSGDYPGPAGLRVILFDHDGSARDVFTWTGGIAP